MFIKKNPKGSKVRSSLVFFRGVCKQLSEKLKNSSYHLFAYIYFDYGHQH
ncbi:hypothetical protein JOC85_002537 [Bacillus mesophilus]|nr:hypothetical protein [Bacillus mesophilus]